MTLDEIKDKYYAEIKTAKMELNANLKKYLEEHELNGEVIRVRDGKNGKIGIVDSEYRFYPYTKNGDISKVSSGCIYTWGNHVIDEYRKSE